MNEMLQDNCPRRGTSVEKTGPLRPVGRYKSQNERSIGTKHIAQGMQSIFAIIIFSMCMSYLHYLHSKLDAGWKVIDWLEMDERPENSRQNSTFTHKLVLDPKNSSQTNLIYTKTCCVFGNRCE